MGERDDIDDELLLAAAKQHGERIADLERQLRNVREELSLLRQRYRELRDRFEAFKMAPR